MTERQKTITMRCFGELGFSDDNTELVLPVRTFSLCHETSDSHDYSCDHCGWLQLSEASGAEEAAECFTWNSLEAFKATRDEARRLGREVLEFPEYIDNHRKGAT